MKKNPQDPHSQNTNTNANAMYKPSQKLIVQTDTETVEFPEVNIQSVWYGNQKISDLNALIVSIQQLRESSARERAESIAQDNRRTRRLVRGFGFSAMFVALVAIGLGSYLVHAENKDMVKIDAIYNRIAAVEASPFNVGDIVCFKLLDSEASNDKTRVLRGLRPVLEEGTPPETLPYSRQLDRLEAGDFIVARGEIVEHHQTKVGTWYAKIAIAGVFARADKTKFIEAKQAVIVSLREVKLELAKKQIKFNKFD